MQSSHISMENVSYDFDFNGISHLSRNHQHSIWNGASVSILYYYAHLQHMHCRPDDTLSTLWYIKQFVRSGIVFRNRNDTIAQLCDLWFHFFSNISNMHCLPLCNFHFLRLICINPNNFTAGFVSGNESRKTITIPKLLMMR